MRKLPKGWVGSSIGDLCDLVNGRAFKPSDWTEKGLPIIRIQNLNRPDAEFNHFDGAVEKKFLVNTGDLLFAWSGTPGTSFGAHIWNGPKAILNQHIFNIRYDAGAIDKTFFKYAINQTLEEQIAKAHGGVGLRHVTKGMFEETSIPVPPLAEQRRIVAKIDSLSAQAKRAREQLNRVSRLVEKYRQAILSSAFRGDLTKDRHAKTVGAHWPWPEVALSEVAHVGTGSTPKRGEPRYYSDGHIPWVTSGAVNAPVVEAAEEFITDAAIRETNCKVFPAGTILMAMYGEGQTRGRVAILGLAAATNQALAAIQIPTDSPVVRDFLLWHLRSGYLQLRAQAAGGVQPNLNLGMIKAWRLPLPSKAEQYEIVRRIEIAWDWVNRLMLEASSASRLLEHLDHAIVAKAFRGELVEPLAEPAAG